MNKSIRVLVLGILSLFLIGCARPEPKIDLASVERVITTLAADEMMGRRPLTPGIDKAADFIRDEFASIGLEMFGELDDYLQRFSGYGLETQHLAVVLNGIEIPSERAAVWPGTPSVHWTNGNPVEVVVIGPEDDPNLEIGPVESVYFKRSDLNTLVLLSSNHEAFFDRFRDRVSWVTERLLDPPSGATLVCVLTEEASATSYQVDVIASVEELPLTNVVGMIPGKRHDEIVLFGSHYDHDGILDPVDGDSIANGANDGGSQTTAIIELARYFKAKGEPERTLIFAAFTAHETEWFMLGSKYFSRQLDPEQIVAMFSIAGIGKVDARGPSTAYITGFDRSDLGEILQHAVEGTVYSFYPNPYLGQGLFFRSDNFPFARLGVPAHAISTDDPQDEDRHTVSDEVETLDLVHLTSLIRGIALGAATIISGEATPTRIELPFRR